MLAKTKYFGEVDLDEKKILSFENGIIGFSEFTKWTIMFDIEKKDKNPVSWLQSLDEPGLAIPLINPFSFVEQYNPMINDDYLADLGEFNEDELIVLVSMTVPKDVKAATANLRAPFIINTANNKGVQVIVENEEFPVKFGIYEAVQKMKKEKGED